MKNGKKLDNRVLAEGEVTGHAHRLLKTDVYEMEDGTREFEVNEADTLTHEEHGPLDLTSGQYVSGRVLELDPFEKIIREVQD